MAHYALLDETNTVVQVITGVDENELIDGMSAEQWYGQFHNMTCVRTSYNTINNTHREGGKPFRKNYASIGGKYIPELDAFVQKKPYPSWKMDYQIWDWVSPIPKPEDGENYLWKWNELEKEWVQVFFELPENN
jgi:hypothetical protein